MHNLGKKKYNGADNIWSNCNRDERKPDEHRLIINHVYVKIFLKKGKKTGKGRDPLGLCGRVLFVCFWY